MKMTKGIMFDQSVFKLVPVRNISRSSFFAFVWEMSLLEKSSVASRLL